MPDYVAKPVLILPDEVLRRCGARKKSTIWRWMQDDFPMPVRLTPNGSRIAWYEHEIDAWIENRPRGMGRPATAAWDASRRKHGARPPKVYSFTRRAPVKVPEAAE